MRPNAFILPNEAAAKLRRYFESLPAWPGRDFIELLDGLPPIAVSQGAAPEAGALAEGATDA